MLSVTGVYLREIMNMIFVILHLNLSHLSIWLLLFLGGWGWRMGWGDDCCNDRHKRIPNLIIVHHVADVRMDWKVYNYQEEDEKLVDLIVAYGRPFPPRDANGAEVLPSAPGKYFTLVMLILAVQRTFTETCFKQMPLKFCRIYTYRF